MHYYNGVYFGNSFFMRWTLLFLALFLIVISSLILTDNESPLLSAVSLLANIFLISFGIMLLVCYILCYEKGKKVPREKIIMHFHETSTSSWLSELSAKCTCEKCHSKFYGYLPKYCSLCGSEFCDWEAPKNEERYSKIPSPGHAQLLFLAIFITCIDIYFCIISPNDAESLAIFFIIFESYYLLFFGLAFLLIHYSKDEFDKPRFIEHAKCYGLHYMVFDTLPSFCPSCNYVLNIADGPYCTKCGNSMNMINED